MVDHETVLFTVTVVFQFFAIDGGHGGFGGEKIVGMGRTGKEAVKVLCSVSRASARLACGPDRADAGGECVEVSNRLRLI